MVVHTQQPGWWQGQGGGWWWCSSFCYSALVHTHAPPAAGVPWGKSQVSVMTLKALLNCSSREEGSNIGCKVHTHSTHKKPTCMTEHWGWGQKGCWLEAYHNNRRKAAWGAFSLTLAIWCTSGLVQIACPTPVHILRVLTLIKSVFCPLLGAQDMVSPPQSQCAPLCSQVGTNTSQQSYRCLSPNGRILASSNCTVQAGVQIQRQLHKHVKPVSKALLTCSGCSKRVCSKNG